MKSVPRFGSIAGGCQIAPPLYPPGCAPIVRHVERFPKHRTGFHIKRNNTPAKAATRICRIEYQGFFTRRKTYVNNTVEDNRGPSDDCSRMSIHLCHPPECSCFPITEIKFAV